MTSLWMLLVGAQLALTPAAQASPSPACIGCRADFAQIRSEYTDAEWKKLRRGEVVTSNREATGKSGVRGSLESSVIIPRRPADVWSVLSDYPNRADFTPGLEEVHVVRKQGDRVWLKERVGVWWFKVRYQLIGTLKPALGLMTWKLDKSAPHDIANSRGSWQLVPLPPGGRTLVRYSARVDTGKPVPRFLEDLLTERSLPKVVSSLRAEVERRYAAGETSGGAKP